MPHGDHRAEPAARGFAPGVALNPGTTDLALAVHLVRPGAGLDDGFRPATGVAWQQRFGIGDPALQPEAGEPAHRCPLAAAEELQRKRRPG